MPFARQFFEAGTRLVAALPCPQDPPLSPASPAPALPAGPTKHGESAKLVNQQMWPLRCPCPRPGDAPASSAQTWSSSLATWSMASLAAPAIRPRSDPTPDRIDGQTKVPPVVRPGRESSLQMRTMALGRSVSLGAVVLASAIHAVAAFSFPALPLPVGRASRAQIARRPALSMCASGADKGPVYMDYSGTTPVYTVAFKVYSPIPPLLNTSLPLAMFPNEIRETDSGWPPITLKCGELTSTNHGRRCFRCLLKDGGTPRRTTTTVRRPTLRCATQPPFRDPVMSPCSGDQLVLSEMQPNTATTGGE